MRFIDTHSHIFSAEFAEDTPQVIARAQEAGVSKMILPGIDAATQPALEQLCDNNPSCYPTTGLHPTSVTETWTTELEFVANRLQSGRKYYAIGEIGLDRYWSIDFFGEQLQALETQLQWALEYDLPVILHTRNAFDEMYEVLIRYRDTPLRGVFHGFGENSTVYEKMAIFDRFFFGIGGVVTFKNSPLAVTVAGMDINRIVLETDAPYLTPAPYRGKRNEPARIPLIAAKIAEIKGISTEEIARTTTRNAEELFGI